MPPVKEVVPEQVLVLLHYFNCLLGEVDQRLKRGLPSLCVQQQLPIVMILVRLEVGRDGHGPD